MSETNILNNAAAMEVLRTATAALQAMGVPCILAPMSLPQGMSVSLHVGATTEQAVAANLAASEGGEYAGASATHTEFASKLEHALADPEIVRLAQS